MSLVLGEAAPLAPVVPWAALGFGAFAFYLVMFGLKNGYHHSLGALLLYLAEKLRGVRWVGGTIANAIESIDHQVEQALASGLAGAETAVGKWWYYTKEVADYLMESLAYFGASTLDGFANLVHATIPHIAVNVARPAIEGFGRVTKVIRTTDTQLRSLVTRYVKAIEAQIARDFGNAWRGIDYLKKAAIPELWRVTHGLEADVGHLEQQVGRVIPARLTRLEKWLGAGVIGGAAIAAITRVFPYWQCSSVKRLNRLVCRSPLGALDDLLGLGFLVLGPLSIVQFAHELQAVTEPVADGVHYFVHE